MLRGHRTYLQLFDETNNPTVIKPERRGRSEKLLNKRNELLIHRYYYYVKISGYQYMKVLGNLEDELFVARQTIVNIVGEKKEMLTDLNLTKPPLTYFRKKFPFMVW